MDYKEKYEMALERAKSLIGDTIIEESGQHIAEVIFPELKESKDEKIKKAIHIYLDWLDGRKDYQPKGDYTIKDMLVWLEKQGKQHSAIRWYDVSLIPQEMEELLVEWDSEDATWHEIAFYHADTKTFWNGTRQVENVTRWCYIIDLLEKQGEQKVNYTTLVETGNGGINALVTREVSTNDYEEKPVGKVEPKFHEGEWITIKE